jgi:lantibiotic modifying enzyme
MLIYAVEVLGDELTKEYDLAVRVGRESIASGRPLESLEGWAISEADGLGLFLGLAGIGYYYIRLFRSTTPSVLVMYPESFSVI